MASLLGILFVLLIVALVIAIVLTVLEKITKFAIPLIIIVLIVVGAFYFVADVADLKLHFGKDNKLYLLELDDEIAGAFTQEGDVDPVVITDLTKYQDLSEQDLEALSNNFYKIITVKWTALDDVDSVTVDKDDYSSSQAKTSLKSSKDDRLKSSLFKELYLQLDTNLIELYRKGHVEFYPETMGLKVINLIPEFILKKLVK